MYNVCFCLPHELMMLKFALIYVYVWQFVIIEYFYVLYLLLKITCLIREYVSAACTLHFMHMNDEFVFIASIIIITIIIIIIGYDD